MDSVVELLLPDAVSLVKRPHHLDIGSDLSQCLRQGEFIQGLDVGGRVELAHVEHLQSSISPVGILELHDEVLIPVRVPLSPGKDVLQRRFAQVHDISKDAELGGDSNKCSVDCLNDSSPPLKVGLLVSVKLVYQGRLLHGFVWSVCVLGPWGDVPWFGKSEIPAVWRILQVVGLRLLR